MVISPPGFSQEEPEGWALCCASLSAPTFRELMELAGFYLPLSPEDLTHFDTILRRYRALPLPDQIVLRRKLLWHILGLRSALPEELSAGPARPRTSWR